MMLTVWKYPLKIVDSQEIQIPRGAEPLCVQLQRGELNLWARINPSSPSSTMNIFVHGTGHMCTSSKYLGTFQMAEEALVFHVFWE